MTTRALIVEDDPYTAESFKDFLVDMLEHKADVAGSFKEARGLLDNQAYTYAILDMAIPPEPGKLPQREMGRLLLEQIRQTPRHADLPVLVVTGEDRGDSDFIRSVMRAGGYDLPKMDYLQKITIQLDKSEINYEVLTKRITSLLAARPGAIPAVPPQKPTSAFSAQPRRLTIYRHRVDVCGVKIWDETESPDLRSALVRLSRRDSAGRYTAIHGTELSPERNASNKISGPIRNFRGNATDRLRADRDLECGLDDIIGNERRKGYFLQEWIEVEVIDADGPDDMACATSVLCRSSSPSAPDPDIGQSTMSLTLRQRDILAHMAAAPTTQKDLLSKIKVGKSTLNRDLAAMREAGLFVTRPDGQYALTEAGRYSLGGVVPRGPIA